MSDEEFEKPALVEEMGELEGLTISKGPDLLPPPEALEGPDEETGDADESDGGWL